MFNTLYEYKFKAEYWDYTTAQDVSGQPVRTYFKDSEIKVAIIVPEKGTMYLFYPEQLRYNAQIRNLMDASGELLFDSPMLGAPTPSYVGVSEPVLDVFGNRIGFRHDLSQGLTE